MPTTEGRADIYDLRRLHEWQAQQEKMRVKHDFLAHGRQALGARYELPLTDITQQESRLIACETVLHFRPPIDRRRRSLFRRWWPW